MRKKQTFNATMANEAKKQQKRERKQNKKLVKK